jgi:DDE superfamily endonuclease
VQSRTLTFTQRANKDGFFHTHNDNRKDPFHKRSSGFALGVQTDYRGGQIAMPTKKPRKSTKNPSPALSTEQKAANKAVSQVRIFVEHAIGGMKRFNILVHTFRNRIENFEDDVIGVCAGLWNLVLSY